MHRQARAHHKLLIGPAWLTPGACSKITVLEKPNTGRPSIKLTFVITDLTLLLLLRQVVFITLLRSWHHMAKGMQLSRKRKDRMRVSHRHQVNEAKPRCHPPPPDGRPSPVLGRPLITWLVLWGWNPFVLSYRSVFVCCPRMLLKTFLSSRFRGR